MEESMKAITSNAVRRTVISTLAALVLAATVPQAGMAMSAWRVDGAKSNNRTGSVTLDIERVNTAGKAPGSFIVIANGNVYRVTGAAVDEASRVDSRKAVLIGTRARATNHCGRDCQFGDLGPRMTLTFRAASGAGQQINEMLAEGRTSVAAPSR